MSNKNKSWAGRVQNKNKPTEKQEAYNPFGEDAKDMFESLFGKNEALDTEIADLTSELDDMAQSAMDAVIRDIESSTESA